MADDTKKITPKEHAKDTIAVLDKQTIGKESEHPTPGAEATPSAKEAEKQAPEKGGTPVQEDKAAHTSPADKKRPENVVEISGAMIDKILAEKAGAAHEAERIAAKVEKPTADKTEQVAAPKKEKPTAEKKLTKEAKVEPARFVPKKTAPPPEKPIEPEKPAKPVAAPPLRRSGANCPPKIARTPCVQKPSIPSAG